MCEFIFQNKIPYTDIYIYIYIYNKKIILGKWDEIIKMSLSLGQMCPGMSLSGSDHNRISSGWFVMALVWFL